MLPIALPAASETAHDGSLIPGLVVEVEMEANLELKENFDLDEGTPDNLVTLEPETGVVLVYRPVNWFEAEVKFNLTREFALREEGPDEARVAELDLEEAFVTFKNLYGGFGVQLGRQKFLDQREWLYDEELDAALIWFEGEGLRVEFSASRLDLVDRELLHKSRKKGERINNYIMFTEYEATEDITLNGYLVARDDRTGREGDPILLGVRSKGEIYDGLDHWFELAYLTGKDKGKDLGGFAIDIGATYKLNLPLNPYVTLGYAFGSGDPDPNDGTDEAFRQTGLQENEAKFGGGIPRIKYYGEVFDPELSNLHIFTAGLGLRPTESFSINFVYHRYKQDTIADELRNAEFDEPNQDPTRQSKDLGDEVDIVLGFRDIFGVNELGVDLVLGYFFPGRAYRVKIADSVFADADEAFFLSFQIGYAF